jgi:hypothetical protein
LASSVVSPLWSLSPVPPSLVFRSYMFWSTHTLTPPTAWAMSTTPPKSIIMKWSISRPVMEVHVPSEHPGPPCDSVSLMRRYGVAGKSLPSSL